MLSLSASKQKRRGLFGRVLCRLGSFPSGLCFFTGHGGLSRSQQVRLGVGAKIKVKEAIQTARRTVHMASIISWRYRRVKHQNCTVSTPARWLITQSQNRAINTGDSNGYSGSLVGVGSSSGAMGKG